MNAPAERFTPHAVPAEQAMLGAMMSDTEALDDGCEFCSSDLFYDPLHRRMFDAICELHGRGEKVTALTLRTQLADDHGLRELERTPGGENYFVKLCGCAPILAISAIEPAICEMRAAKVRRDALHLAGYDAAQSDAERRLRPILWADISTTVLRRELLVQGLLDRGSFSVMQGASGSGKTFLAIDIGLHLALGRDWRGLRVRQGGVIYLAAEAGLGIAERLEAFRLHYGADPATVPFAVIPAQINLCDPSADTSAIISEIQVFAAMIAPVELVIVDTLSRAMAGGNENAPDDMGAFVGNIDRIRAETSAHSLVVHHLGKDSGRGARGHNSLTAAADTVIEVAKDEVSKSNAATVIKQRDRASGQVFAFALKPIEIGQDEDEEASSSCVIVAVEGVEPTRQAPKLTPTARVGLAYLTRCLCDLGQPAPPSNHIPKCVQTVTLTAWKDYLLKAGILNAKGNPREQFRRIRVTLQNARLIGVWEDNVWTVT